MESFYIIVPVATIFCIAAVAAWLWANQDGQFDDLDREAYRILEEDPVLPATVPTIPDKKNTHDI
jgi:cbb3-type cytochrome oxidase maturation protein